MHELNRPEIPTMTAPIASLHRLTFVPHPNEYAPTDAATGE